MHISISLKVRLFVPHLARDILYSIIYYIFRIHLFVLRVFNCFFYRFFFVGVLCSMYYIFVASTRAFRACVTLLSSPSARQNRILKPLVSLGVIGAGTRAPRNLHLQHNKRPAADDADDAETTVHHSSSRSAVLSAPPHNIRPLAQLCVVCAEYIGTLVHRITHHQRAESRLRGSRISTYTIHVFTHTQNTIQYARVQTIIAYSIYHI